MEKLTSNQAINELLQQNDNKFIEMIEISLNTKLEKL